MITKKILPWIMAFVITVFSAISTTMPLFQVDLVYFVLMCLIFAGASIYFNYRRVGSLFRFADIYREVKGSKGQKLRFLFAILLGMASSAALYFNNFIYSYFFMIDHLAINYHVAFIFLQCAIVPLTLVLSCIAIKDIWFLLGDMYDFIRKCSIPKPTDLCLYALSIGLGAYMAYWTTNISVLGIQLFQLTFSSNQMIASMPDVFYVILFFTAFIMFSGTLNFVFNKILDLCLKKEQGKWNCFMFLGICAQVVISTLSAERRVGAAGLCLVGGADVFFSKEENATVGQQLSQESSDKVI